MLSCDLYTLDLVEAKLSDGASTVLIFSRIRPGEYLLLFDAFIVGIYIFDFINMRHSYTEEDDSAAILLMKTQEHARVRESKTRNGKIRWCIFITLLK